MEIHNDVNLEPNWAVVHEYFMQKSETERYEELFRVLTPHISSLVQDMAHLRQRKKFYVRYPDTWQPLSVWNMIERGLINVLGHGFHLREVGRYSRFVGFGLDALKAGAINNAFGRLITSPADGYKNVRFVAKRCVRNKEMGFVQTDRDSGYVVMKHHRDIADPLDDFWSIASFIVGHGDAVNLFWHQYIDDKAQSTIVATGILDVLKREAPSSYAYIRDEKLYIDDLVYGKIVYCVPHESGLLLDPNDALSHFIEGSVPGILITTNFETACLRCEDALRIVKHPIVMKGQLFQISSDKQHHFPNSAFRAHWKATWIDRLKGISSQFIMKKALAHAETQVELTDVRLELTDTKDELSAVTTVIEQGMPTKQLAFMFAHGTLEPFSRDAIVLQFDLVGFTELVKRYGWTPEDQAEHVGKLVCELLRVGVRNGGWDYKVVGDCGVMVFCPNWPRHMDEKNPFPHLRRAGEMAVRSAFQMHQTAHALSMEIRVGIHVGGTTWRQDGMYGEYDIIAPRFEANGDAFNFAARLEQSLKDHNPPLASYTRISHELMCLIHGERLVLEAKKNDMFRLSGGFKYDGFVTVKTDAIECWSRCEAPKSVEITDILDIPSLADVFPDERERARQSGVRTRETS